MSLKKITEAAVRVIRDLPTRPTGPTGRFTAAQLQAFFDKAAVQIREAFNELVDELESSSGAGDIGFSPTAGVNESNVQAAIENVQAQAVNAAMGEFPDASIESKHIKPGEVKETNIEDEAVTEPKVEDGAITEPKIAVNAVTAEKLAPGAVGWTKIAAEDLYLDASASGSVYGNSMTITKEIYWYSAALKMVFWNVHASVNATEAGIIFMPKMNGLSKYRPFLEQGQTSVEYCGSGGDIFSRADIVRDSVGNGSYLLAVTEKAGDGQTTIISGFYICVGE